MMFKVGDSVYWVGWDCGYWEIFGPDKITKIGNTRYGHVYEMEWGNCVCTTVVGPYADIVFATETEAKKYQQQMTRGIMLTEIFITDREWFFTIKGTGTTVDYNKRAYAGAQIPPIYLLLCFCLREYVYYHLVGGSEATHHTFIKPVLKAKGLY